MIKVNSLVYNRSTENYLFNFKNTLLQSGYNNVYQAEFPSSNINHYFNVSHRCLLSISRYRNMPETDICTTINWRPFGTFQRYANKDIHIAVCLLWNVLAVCIKLFDYAINMINTKNCLYWRAWMHRLTRESTRFSKLQLGSREKHISGFMANARMNAFNLYLQ